MLGRPHADIACLRCRTRKKRCDRASPSCSSCVAAQAPCLKLRRSRLKSEQQHGRLEGIIEALERRIYQLENQSISPRVQPPDVTLTPARYSGNSASEGQRLSPTSSEHCSLGLVEPAESISQDALQCPSPCVNTGGRDQRPENEVHDHGSAYSVLPPGRLSSFPGLEQILQYKDTDTARERVYFDLYFQIIQPQWPLLEVMQCLEWFEQWFSGYGAGSELQQSIIKLICATGALFCTSFNPHCQHLETSKSLHTAALSLGGAKDTQNSLLRLQFLLSQVIYQLHYPDLQVVDGSARSTAESCREVLEESSFVLMSLPKEEFSLLGPFETINHNTRNILTLYFTINEVVHSSWDLGTSDALKNLDKALSHIGAQLDALCTAHTGAFEHVFRLRYIQSKIRRLSLHKHMDQSGHGHPEQKKALHAELNVWRSTIQEVSDENDPSVNHQPKTMMKLYDYCLCILYEDDLFSLQTRNLETVLLAASEACLSFRNIQEAFGMTYFTCSALLTQFRIGMILLYCYWVTPYNSRTPAYLAPSTTEAIEACHGTLSAFARRWPSAILYRDTYEIVSTATPYIILDTERSHCFPHNLITTATELRDKLRVRRTPLIVRAILDKIISM